MAVILLTDAPGDSCVVRPGTPIGSGRSRVRPDVTARYQSQAVAVCARKIGAIVSAGHKRRLWAAGGATVGSLGSGRSTRRAAQAMHQSAQPEDC